MQEVDFEIPDSVSISSMDAAIEIFCEHEGLEISLKSTLATYPGSVHWHFRKPGERGTLEITSYAAGKRIWAKIQNGRRAEWIEPTLTKIKHRIESSTHHSATDHK
jgi:hypothetical protein